MGNVFSGCWDLPPALRKDRRRMEMQGAMNSFGGELTNSVLFLKHFFPAQGQTLNAVAMRRALRNAPVSFALTASLCPHLRKHHLIDISLDFIFKRPDIVFNDVIISGKDKPSCARGEVAGVTCGNKVPSLLYFYNYPN